jgi:hypothetical protein
MIDAGENEIISGADFRAIVEPLMKKVKDYSNPACPQGFDSYEFKTKEGKKQFIEQCST